MQLLTAIPLLVAALATAVDAGGFIKTCSVTAVADAFLFTVCDKDSHASKLDLNLCYANDHGKIVPRNNGHFHKTCKDCIVQRDGWMTCKCQDGRGGAPESKINLDELITNYDGRIGCYTHLGT
ncbi:uncharacterized protein CIMG_09050 [Coccidioides immitis RS]|uniref:Cyanovirin-N domain-containing protein n=3 Tax=Coccidioides immitis TaxID=5501 RepID=A0A0E1RUK5_COCIM|nr:uncharacterized protein CIMG_09050 [Coccidioides immitis RS]EAS27846.1 hypothetical protein CIMG_09050 [Coccidioides immitis RS]KMU78635.1 hypothetical protein CISG_01675 [Coccidioides immitis RMSCC 3703]KMU87452.1 hypothetical protein CIHG_05247 [Coccidioides immitis H538.4]TPX20544.1 hypothetical protein DIZ76_016436 [Coccidioides immitis]